MCGIGGIVVRDGGKVCSEELAVMAKRLQHRGPDGHGFATYTPGGRVEAAHEADALAAARVGLVHLRLSIIDTTEGGWQPMLSADGRYAIVFNGEIYNFVELRAELEKKGHVFRSGSDTEVLLAAWAAWGANCLPRLVGMFAFAILDTRANTIILARDGFGIKPLFYVSTAQRFAFASELKAIIPLWSDRRRANGARVFDYLRSGITDRGGDTMLEDFHQVPAGHWATVSLLDTANPTFTAFWTPKRKERLDLSYDEAVAKTRDLFVKSVRLHLRSDVPVGACLSGGIDSSAIVSVMREIEGAGLDLHTFTYVADAAEVSEEHWAEIVARNSNTTEHKIKPNADNLVDDLETLIACQDEPFGSTSIYAQYCVFRLVASTGIKVVLDGQGADEMLGGYAGHSGARLASLIRERRFGAAGAFWRSKPVGYGGRFGRLMAAQYLLPKPAQGVLRKMIGRSEMPPWLDAEWFRANAEGASSVGPSAGGDLMDELAADVRGNLPPLLRYEDRNSMHYSVESRVPFLTPELCDFFLALPEEYVISDDGTSKAVLRAALRGIVPDAILDRRDKVGFRTPEWQWMRTVRPWAERILTSDAARALPVFRHEQLLAAWRRSLEKPSRHHPWIWRWINFIRWSEINDVQF
ncbi:MAG: asparagine synthase (glutamine-hydrolyzing) [Gemmatimonadaceae bacterium]